MPKFYGKIGYGLPVERAPGVWKDDIVEQTLYGDVIRTSRRLEDGNQVNNDLTVGNSISVVADAYAMNHFFAIKYVVWAGAFWMVDDVRVESPRLILRLGGVYHGQKARPSVPAGDTPG